MSKLDCLCKYISMYVCNVYRSTIIIVIILNSENHRNERKKAGPRKTMLLAPEDQKQTLARLYAQA